VIADTSAWVEFLRQTGSRCDLRLRKAFRTEQIVWLPAVVLQELLQGARNPAQFARLEAQLERLPGLDDKAPRDLARDAALLYARCRWQGVSMRSPNDCVVAVCAIASGLPVLARDRDFEAMAQVEPALRLV
jgi:predicted nucleic acid-binding protein